MSDGPKWYKGPPPWHKLSPAQQRRKTVAHQNRGKGGKKTVNSKVDELVKKINALGDDKNKEFIGGRPKGVRGSGYVDTPFGRVPATNFYEGPAKIPSRYKTGQETSILAKVWNDPEEYLAVQAALDADWGMSAPTGSLDGKTISAFKQVLGAANALGVTWRDLLFGDYAAGNGSGDDSSSSSSGGGSGGGGLLVDPEEVRQAADITAQETIGMNLDPGTREAITGTVVNEATNAVDAYDIQAQLRRKVKEAKPGDAIVNDTFNVFNHFASILGPGGLLGGGGSITGPATGAGTGVR